MFGGNRSTGYTQKNGAVSKVNKKFINKKKNITKAIRNIELNGCNRAKNYPKLIFEAAVYT